MTIRNTPWTMQERHTCRAIVDSRGQDIGHVEKDPSFFEGRACGSVTSRGYSSEELLQRIQLWTAAPEILAALTEIVSQIDQGGSGGKVFSRDSCIQAARDAIAKARGV